jgi:hypothetical protein
MGRCNSDILSLASNELQQTNHYSKKTLDGLARNSII